MILQPEPPFNRDLLESLSPKVGDRVVWAGMPGIFRVTDAGNKFYNLRCLETGEEYFSIRKDTVSKYVQPRAPKQAREKETPEQVFKSLDDEFNS